MGMETGAAASQNIVQRWEGIAKSVIPQLFFLLVCFLRQCLSVTGCPAAGFVDQAGPESRDPPTSAL